MKDVQKELLAISTALSSLVAKVEKMVEAIETESGKAAPAIKAKPAKKAKATAKKAKATPKQAKAAPKKRAAKKKAPTTEEEAQPATAESQQTMLDNIFVMISRSRNGITVERLKKRTGLEARQVSNALYKLTKKGRIETLSRGVYVKKKS
jgi:predicted Rossmann fold nucleotide-binding protein DprA/Smf involved in DNA uptake